MNANVTVLYRTSAKVTGGRDGTVSTPDGSLALRLATPKELGGPGGPGNNPEQLFAAGYAACFLNGMKLIARETKVPFPADANITATVGIGPRESGGFGLTADLSISVPGMDRKQADELIAKTDTVCPYSNSIRSNVAVKFPLV